MEEPLGHPRRDVVERALVGRARDTLALEPLVEIQDVDVLRAARIGGTGDPARDVLLADRARHCDELPGLDVRAEDRELGELPGPLLDPTHARHPTVARMARCG